MKNLFTLALLLGSGLAGCSTDSTPVPQTPKELLTSRNWVRTAVMEQQDEDPVQDRYPFIPPCERDDLYAFRPDGTYTVLEGDVTCQNPTSIIGIGSWELAADNTSLLRVTRYTKPSGVTHTLTVTVEELTKDKLVIVEAETDFHRRIVTTRTTYAAHR